MHRMLSPVSRSRQYSVYTDVIFGLASPDYPQVPILVRRCNLNFRGREATNSMTSEVKTEAIFGLIRPSHLLGSVFPASIGPIEAATGPNKRVPPKRKSGLKYKTCRLRRR